MSDQAAIHLQSVVDRLREENEWLSKLLLSEVSLVDAYIEKCPEIEMMAKRFIIHNDARNYFIGTNEVLPSSIQA